MLRLQLAGADTLITTRACAACGHSPAGCCAAPPRVSLSDIGRIVAHGGRDFLLRELEAGRLLPGPGNMWLVLPRRPRQVPEGAPPLAACTYLGATGCVLAPELRAATCNYYVCEDVLAAAGPGEEPARAALGRLVDTFAGWDEELADRVRARWTDGHVLDADFLDWLGSAFREVSAR